MTDLFTIGQMAEYNHVTKKALMIYQKHGLLAPEKVDPETGYRYYTLQQCPALDMILQLQQIGFSLDEIKKIIDSRDVAQMESMVRDQVARQLKKLEELRLSLSTAREMLKTCEIYQSNPTFGEVTLEYLPRRNILRYNVPPYRVQTHWEENPGLTNWEMSLRSIKQQMLEAGLPLVLFHNIGCIVSRESLEKDDYFCPGGFLFCPPGFQGVHTCWDEGWCLTVTIDRMFDENGVHQEHKYIETLVGIARREGYRIRDDYYCEVLADTPAFFYRGRDMMLRMRLPVEVENPAASPYYKPQ